MCSQGDGFDISATVPLARKNVVEPASAGLIIITLLFIPREYGLPSSLEREPPSMLDSHGGGTCRRQVDNQARIAALRWLHQPLSV